MRIKKLIPTVLLVSCIMYAGQVNASTASNSTVNHPDQMKEPFRAFGNLSYMGGDYYYTKNGKSEKIGQISYEYDAQGNTLKRESSMRNVDGSVIKSLFAEWESIVPDDAAFYDVQIYNGRDKEDSQFYIDPVTGQRVYLSQKIKTYFNGRVATKSDSYIDKNGKIVRYSEVESEFDSQGRPLYTIHNDLHYSYNADSYEIDSVTPSWKLEYEYFSDGMTGLTRSSIKHDSNGDAYWNYDYKDKEGTDSNGAWNCERMLFDDMDSIWYGDYKYSELTEDYNGGIRTTRTEWNWNSTLKDWELSEKTIKVYNSQDNILSSDLYYYSKELSGFYLNRMEGWEYQDDTLQCAEWYINFRMPDTAIQPSEQLSLADYGGKKEYVHYTYQELNLSAGDIENDSLPTKCETEYELKTGNSQSVNWQIKFRTEFEYVLIPAADGSGKSVLALSSKKEYYAGTGSALNLTQVTTLDYNEHGDEIFREYDTGIIKRSFIKDYSYKVHYNATGDSTVEKLIMKDEEWFHVQNASSFCQYSKVYGYDDDGRDTLYMAFSDWDSSTNTWNSGTRQERKYDENGNDTLAVEYSWNPQNTAWEGKSKTMNFYNESGTKWKTLSYYGTQDVNGSTVWIPRKLAMSVITTDADGNVTSGTETCSDWNVETGAWKTGEKKGTVYSANRLTLRKYLYTIKDGEWVPEYDERFEYNAAGKVIRQTSADSLEIVTSYNESGEMTQTYSYKTVNGVRTLVEKVTSTIVNGKVSEYQDSVFSRVLDSGTGTYVSEWVPEQHVRLSYDDATGMITYFILSAWNPDTKEWQYSNKETRLLDSEGRILFSEGYYMEGDYNKQTAAWIGRTRNELAYGPDGKQIMMARYSWDNNTSEWIGQDKMERVFDPVTGKETLSAKYGWSNTKKDWYGINNKTEHAYDVYGNDTLEAEYTWDFNKWKWVGLHKSVWSEKNSAFLEEEYDWDSDRDDWRGKYKSLLYEQDSIDILEEYKWDDKMWCWTGDSKLEFLDFSNGYGQASYIWDADGGCWEGVFKWIDLEENTETYYTLTEISSKWNKNTSCWEPDYRVSRIKTFRNDQNIDNEAVLLEVHDGSSYALACRMDLKYMYDTLTKVDETDTDNWADIDISVSEGSIHVRTTDNTIIRIFSASGSSIANGVGAIDASVTPGIYYISANGKVIKVLVR